MLVPLNISVVIPSYNGKTKGFLDEAIHSVLGQDHKPSEIVFINDGSSDDTGVYVEKTFPEVRVIHQKNLGLAASRNTGILNSSGHWVAFLDDDDVWLPSKLKNQVQYIESHPALAFLSTQAETIGNSPFLQIKGNPFFLDFPFCLARNPIFAPSSVMIRRDVFSDLGLFDPAMRIAEDYDLWVRISMKYPLAIFNQPLIRYRIHADQMTNKFKPLEDATLEIILKYLPNVKSDHRNLLVTAFLNDCLLGALRRMDFRRFLYFRSLFKIYGWDTALFSRRVLDYLVSLVEKNSQERAYRYTYNLLKSRLTK